VGQLLWFSTPVTEHPDESQSCSVEVFDVKYDAETDNRHGLLMVRSTVHAHESTYSDPYAHHATGMLVRLTTSRRKVLSTTEILNFSQSILLFGTLAPSTMRNR
jgi:hypothetical protein